MGFITQANALDLRLPYKNEKGWIVSQGNNETTSHNGDLEYAWDFNIPFNEQNGEDCNIDLGEPVLAPAAGTVVYVYDGNGYNGGWGNMVIIDYGNCLYGRLSHLDTVSVVLNQVVFQGEKIGTVGNTGKTDNCAHIHYQTEDINGVSVEPVANDATFVDPDVLAQNSNGIPTKNNTYTSSNTTPLAIFHFDEGSGSTASDSSGNNYDGTTNGNPVWKIDSSECISGNCLEFDGTDDYVDLGSANESAFDFPDTQFTIAGWVKFNGLGTSTFVAKVGYGTINWQWQLLRVQDTFLFDIVSSSGDIVYRRQSDIYNSKWNWFHFVGVFKTSDSEQVDIYINGELNNVTTKNYSYRTYNTGGNGSVNIGGLADYGGHFLEGKLDEIVIYDKALTATEIQDMYNALKKKCP